VKLAEVSDVALPLWISQLLVAYRCLETQQRVASICDIIDHVRRACEESDLKAWEGIEWYLEQYEFEMAGYPPSYLTISKECLVLACPTRVHCEMMRTFVKTATLGRSSSVQAEILSS
jgi:hypothetical protein